jgi:hypothetical protein
MLGAAITKYGHLIPSQKFFLYPDYSPDES